MKRFRFNRKQSGPMKNICLVASTRNLISGKWKITILFILNEETTRFGELQRKIPNISKGTLTNQLRELEEDGFIQRKVFPEIPPKVEYSLTAIGYSIIPVLLEMGDWGERYLDLLEDDAKKSNL